MLLLIYCKPAIKIGIVLLIEFVDTWSKMLLLTFFPSNLDGLYENLMIMSPNTKGLEGKDEPAIINTNRRHISIQRKFHNLTVSFQTNVVVVVVVVSEETMKKGVSTPKLMVKKPMTSELM